MSLKIVSGIAGLCNKNMSKFDTVPRFLIRAKHIMQWSESRSVVSDSSQPHGLYNPWKWRQEGKGTTEDDMVGWHHRLDGHGFGSWWWTGRPGVLQSMGSQSRTRLSNWTELKNSIWGFISLLKKKKNLKNSLPFEGKLHSVYHADWTNEIELSLL